MNESTLNRVLIVGAWSWSWYEAACASALKTLGCKVERFGWAEEFVRPEDNMVEPVSRSLWARIQNRLLIGPAMTRINRRLKEAASSFQPDVIFLYNCTHIFPGTIQFIRKALPQALFVQYANDNPFTSVAFPDRWRYLKKSIPHVGLHLAYRPSNLTDYQERGARKVRLLRSYFIPDADYRVELTRDDRRFASDIVFAGHFEEDGRAESLAALARAGHALNLFGGGWHLASKELSDSGPLSQHFPVFPVVAANYRKALSGAKIALCYLSKLNADSYTRRNFQIPAIKTFMLSEYSEDLAGMFREGIDAEYFRSRAELLDKAKFYLRNDSAREKIAEKGYARVVKDGHDVRSRMRQFMAHVQEATC